MNIKAILLLAVVVVGCEGAARAETCSTSQCHSGLQDRKFVHRPMKAKGCTVCHELDANGLAVPKVADHPKLKKQSARQLEQNSCFLCHDQTRDGLNAQSKHAHGVIPEKGCSACHDPHSSDHPQLLKSQPDAAFCLKCHDSKIHAQDLPGTHATLPGKNQCLQCHSPHVSKTQACMSCHSKTVARGKVEHEPFAQGKCTECHAPHGKLESRLLKDTYRSQFYASIVEGDANLCFRCHKQELAVAARATTRFRDGERNLHALHVNAQGGVKAHGCAACHSSHATSQPHLLSDWTRFGPAGQEVELPLQFQAGAEGGTCTTACHGQKSYNRTRSVNRAQE